MLLVFGLRFKALLSSWANIVCRNCGHEVQVAHILLRYFHIFWIPVVPVGKRTVLECPHCKYARRQEELSTSELALIVPVKKAAKTPLWMYTGLFIIFLIVGNIAYQDWKNPNHSMVANNEAILDQAVGTRTSIFANGVYNVLEFKSISKDSIRYKLLRATYKTKAEVRSKAIRDNDFDPELWEISRSDFVNGRFMNAHEVTDTVI